jgi:hypothetical protein
MFSEGNAAHPVGYDSLQIIMAVWHPFFKFDLPARGVTALY